MSAHWPATIGRCPISPTTTRCSLCAVRGDRVMGDLQDQAIRQHCKPTIGAPVPGARPPGTVDGCVERSKQSGANRHLYLYHVTPPWLYDCVPKAMPRSEVLRSNAREAGIHSRSDEREDQGCSPISRGWLQAEIVTPRDARSAGFAGTVSSRQLRRTPITRLE